MDFTKVPPFLKCIDALELACKAAAAAAAQEKKARPAIPRILASPAQEVKLVNE